MKTAVHAEWTKLRTVAGPAWLLLGAVAATVALGVLTVSSAQCRTSACGLDAAKVSLGGVQLGQAVVAVLAVLVVGSEYSTGMIGPSLAAVPRRLVLLAAKALVLLAPVLLAGAVAVGIGLLVGRSQLPLAVSTGPTLRAAGGSVLYLALVALLSLGLATAVRDSATAVGLVLGLLYLFPILASLVTDPAWHRHLQQIGPASAGLSIQATVRLGELSIGPWSGLGVLGLWAAGALLLGGAALALRDA